MQTMSVTFDGETYVLDRVGIADLVAFERNFKVRAQALEPKPVVDENGDPVCDDEGNPIVQAEIYLEWIAFLLWRSLRRQKVIERKVQFDDDFLERIDNVAFVETPSEDPTDEDQQPA
jgi:hypothetical protein